MHSNQLCKAASRPLRAALCGLLCAQGAAAQEAAAPALPEVTVRSVLSPTTVEKAPAAVTVVGGQQLRERQWQVNLSESLGSVPGMLIQNRQNYAQDLQLSIRGHGARSTFGVRGVRLVADGIPATMPDGQGQAASLDLATAGRIEVLRGPFAALHGNASGGVVQVFTQDAPAVPEGSASLFAGDHGTRRFGLRAGGRWGGADLVAGASRFRTDGHRAHSAAVREQFNAKLGLALGEGRLALIASGIDQPESQDPLGRTRAQFEADPGQADAAALLAAIDHVTGANRPETEFESDISLLELGEEGRRQIASLDEAREMFDGDEAVVQQLLHVFLKDHERTFFFFNVSASNEFYTSLAAVGHSVKGSVGLFCARRAIEAARRLEELAAAQDPQAATGQSQVLVSELKLLAQALRGEVTGGVRGRAM